MLPLLRQCGPLLARAEALEGEGPAEGLAVGETASDFALPSLDGNTVTLESLRAPGKPVVVLFTTPDCGPFVEIFPPIERWQAKHSGTLTIAIVSEGDRGQNATMASEHALTTMLLQEDWEVGEAYGAIGPLARSSSTPTARSAAPCTGAPAR